MPPKPLALFFDIGDTLATPRLTSTGALAALDPFPFVPEILTRLKPLGRLGLISNTGSETMQSLQSLLIASALMPFFDPALLLFSSVEGKDKSQRAFFELAVQRAGLLPSRCVFIGEDAAERAVARSAGLVVSFHPLHVFHVVKQMQ